MLANVAVPEHTVYISPLPEIIPFMQFVMVLFLLLYLPPIINYRFPHSGSLSCLHI